MDCTRCGACCTNPEENRREGFAAYVDVGDREALWRHPKIVTKHVTRDAEGRAHLKLDAGQRCTALAGRLGKRVRCEIYAFRPAPCRRVEAGSEACLRARAERGIAGDA